MSIISLLQNPRKRFEAVVRPHLRALYKRAFRLTQSEHDAEELVQELLLKLYEKNEDLEGLENVEGWMMRVLYNLYVDRWRKDNRNPINQADNHENDILETLETSDRGPSQEIDRLKTQQQIHHALTTLNAEQQLLIVMHDMEGYSLPDLSIILDIPLGTLKSRLHRARQQMKKILQLMEPFEQKVRLLV